MSTINGIYSGQQSGDKMPGTEGKGNNMGQDAFMKLLGAQLQNQDPLKPQENGEFLAQLATFSSLEKLTAIETSIKELTAAFEKLAGEAPAETGDSGAGGADNGSSNSTGN